ncbi:MAG: sugar transferase [Oscillospiraceae bacterium]
MIRSSIRAFHYTYDIFTKVIYIALMFFCFYGMFLLDNPVLTEEMLRVSRVSVILISTFLLVEYILIKAYGGYKIGLRQTREIVLSMCLAVTITDVFAYVQLCVMNKAIVSFWLLLAAIAAQYIITVIHTKLSNWTYFKVFPPKSMLVIYGDEGDMQLVMRKLRKYQNRFRVKKVMRYDEPMLHRSIRAHSSVMLVNVPNEKKEYIIEYCYKREKQVYYVPSFSNILVNTAEYEQIDDITVFHNKHRSLSIEQKIVKRIFDLVVSGVGIILSSPIMLAEAIAIKCEDGGPVFFLQERETINEKKFKVIKFRTMIVDAEKNNEAILASENDPRITKVGAFLRKTRIDELPQLFNVFAGSMSIVGPRPERESIAKEYYKDLPEFAYRLRVKAGLTGYAQIQGKYNTTPKDKLVMDLLYIENYSLGLDFKIALQTLTVFLLPEKSEGFDDDDKVVFIDDSAIDIVNKNNRNEKSE